MIRFLRENGLIWPALWRLALAGLTFMAVYGFCNHFTATRTDVPTIMFDWEKHIPYVRAFVIPYWSLDLFFIASFFICTSKKELNLLTKRLIALIVASGLFFLLFPLKIGLPRPAPEGWTAPFFKALYANDLPYNLAPSLHIGLYATLWVFYGAHLTGWLRSATKFWFFIIGISTMLVWQHHIIDVAGGYAMAWLIMVLVPAESQMGAQKASPKYAWRYGLGAIACLALSFWAFIFVWPAMACAIMTLAYATGLGRILGKENGCFSPAAESCLLPVFFVRWLVQRHWLRGEPAWHEISDGVYFGRKLSEREAKRIIKIDSRELAVLDLTAESNATAIFRENTHYENLPLLDLIPPSAEQIEAALAFISAQKSHGRRVYVHCQLGFQRSARVAANFLHSTGEAEDLLAAQEKIRQVKPSVIF